MFLVTDGTGPRWGWGAGGGDVRWVIPEDPSALDAVDTAQPPPRMDMPGPAPGPTPSPSPAPASDAVLADRGDESSPEVAIWEGGSMGGWLLTAARVWETWHTGGTNAPFRNDAE